MKVNLLKLLTLLSFCVVVTTIVFYVQLMQTSSYFDVMRSEMAYKETAHMRTVLPRRRYIHPVSKDSGFLPKRSNAVTKIGGASLRTNEYVIRIGGGERSRSAVNSQDSLGGSFDNLADVRQRPHVSNKALLKTVQGKKSSRNHNKYLIYLCDRGKPCGGWGDRQRGVVNAFLLAHVTSRTFGLNMSLPCDVINLYVPNAVSWNISEDEIRGKSHLTINSIDDLSFHEILRWIDFNAAYTEDVIFLRTNIEHFWAIRSNPHFEPLLPKWAKRSRFVFFRESWNLLVKPADHLQRHLDDVLHECHFYERTQPLVCVHVRVGVSKSNPRDSESRNDVRELGSLWTFLDSYVRNGSHVFMATDSLEVRHLSRARLGSFHHDAGGTILHVDKQRTDPDSCNGFESALLDQLVLTKCDILVTSNSMFSGRAAMIRGTNDNLFYFDKGEVKKSTLV